MFTSKYLLLSHDNVSIFLVHRYGTLYILVVNDCNDKCVFLDGSQFNALLDYFNKSKKWTEPRTIGSLEISKRRRYEILLRQENEIITKCCLWQKLTPYVPGIEFLLSQFPLPIYTLIDIWWVSTWKDESDFLKIDKLSYVDFPSIRFLGKHFIFALELRDCFLFQLDMVSAQELHEHWFEVDLIFEFAQNNPVIFGSLVKLQYINKV
jgi:hypothetical protein